MGYDWVEQIWEGVLGDELEGNFLEEGLPLHAQSKFECLHGFSGHYILWQLVPVWDYYNVMYYNVMLIIVCYIIIWCSNTHIGQDKKVHQFSWEWGTTSNKAKTDSVVIGPRTTNWRPFPLLFSYFQSLAAFRGGYSTKPFIRCDFMYTTRKRRLQARKNGTGHAYPASNSSGALTICEPRITN